MSGKWLPIMEYTEPSRFLGSGEEPQSGVLWRYFPDPEEKPDDYTMQEIRPLK